jgi:acetyltransferase
LGSQGANTGRIIETDVYLSSKNLLAPRSVALVGASPRPGSVGRAILNNIRKAKFLGEFGLVNSRYSEIDALKRLVASPNYPLCRNWS